MGDSNGSNRSLYWLFLLMLLPCYSCCCIALTRRHLLLKDSNYLSNVADFHVTETAQVTAEYAFPSTAPPPEDAPAPQHEWLPQDSASYYFVHTAIPLSPSVSSDTSHLSHHETGNPPTANTNVPMDRLSVYAVDNWDYDGT
eukprot:NODE_6803_length_488_cov_51.984055_g6010_i0.p1 GENE.NODE_6803_length_488_cov_51.984055_g6010_i0~~NODE_6803_length_488_cov_51.984055_g6010_i0.p1  ORF type:complete len:142 (+),score=16.78 NODE_6803_length_488_cov_51.984055_g6010_i0:29-454(+)